MPSLMAIFGANASPYKRELIEVQSLARQAGVNLQRNLDGVTHGGRSGIIRETLVMIREMARGNWTRVPGSFSLLLQYMGVLKMVTGGTAQAAQVLADAWRKQSEAASLAAIASTRKAAASMAALYAEGGETEANLAEATSAEAKAKADTAAAVAAQAKAVASAEDAAAARLQAGATKASIGPVGAMIGILAGLAAGAFAAWKLTGALIDRLRGLGVAATHLDYVAKKFQASMAGAEAQRETNREILKAVEHYNSMAEAAKRVEAVTKDHFEHLRKMNEYAEQREMATAYDVAQQEEIKLKYTHERLRLNTQERQESLRNKYVEQANLELESREKLAAAKRIAVSSKQRDEEVLKHKKAEAEEAQKYLDELEARGLPGGGKARAKESIVREYNAVALSGVSGRDLDAAERANRLEANRRIKAAKDFADIMAANDDVRKRKSDLEKQGAESAAKAATTALEIKDTVKQNQRRAQEEYEEAVAKTEAEQAKVHGAGYRPDPNSLQRIGAYAAAPTLEMTAINIHRKNEGHLAAIRSDISAMAHANRRARF